MGLWPARAHIQSLSLETQAASAGLALACAYSSSDEYEASVIAKRRSAGAYGRNPSPMLVASIAATAAVLGLLAF